MAGYPISNRYIIRLFIRLLIRWTGVPRCVTLCISLNRGCITPAHVSKPLFGTSASASSGSGLVLVLAVFSKIGGQPLERFGANVADDHILQRVGAQRSSRRQFRVLLTVIVTSVNKVLATPPFAETGPSCTRAKTSDASCVKNILAGGTGKKHKQSGQHPAALRARKSTLCCLLPVTDSCNVYYSLTFCWFGRLRLKPRRTAC